MCKIGPHFSLNTTFNETKNLLQNAEWFWLKIDGTYSAVQYITGYVCLELINFRQIAVSTNEPLQQCKMQNCFAGTVHTARYILVLMSVDVDQSPLMSLVMYT